VRWRFASEPSFDNQIATLHWTGQSATMTFERAAAGRGGEPKLAQTFEQTLTG
jgi:hypothetical protein